MTACLSRNPDCRHAPCVFANQRVALTSALIAG
ncbi:hypothetical protein MXAN_2594 [Myxococcus xanthus DK 1622]|uniref:Uncharacterized protein n=1 Tax=Myxococcus xanthus (strain DK1622) TaxID=246197 RepID=Q1D960_MYXXD|nr:hypothetical protein MXAN_2594 [Myxococcus xanthus DK 1622]